MRLVEAEARAEQDHGRFAHELRRARDQPPPAAHTVGVHYEQVRGRRLEARQQLLDGGELADARAERDHAVTHELPHEMRAREHDHSESHRPLPPQAE